MSNNFFSLKIYSKYKKENITKLIITFVKVFRISKSYVSKINYQNKKKEITSQIMKIMNETYENNLLLRNIISVTLYILNKCVAGRHYSLYIVCLVFF